VVVAVATVASAAVVVAAAAAVAVVAAVVVVAGGFGFVGFVLGAAEEAFEPADDAGAFFRGGRGGGRVGRFVGGGLLRGAGGVASVAAEIAAVTLAALAAVAAVVAVAPVTPLVLGAGLEDGAVGLRLVLSGGETGAFPALGAAGFVLRGEDV